MYRHNICSYILLSVIVRIGEEGTYELGATEMLNTVTSPVRREIMSISVFKILLQLLD